MSKYLSFLSCIILLGYSSIYGQLFINGADVHALPQSIIYVNNDSLLIGSNGYFLHEGYLLVDKDVIVNSGQLENDGEIDIEQNFINNDLTDGVSNSSIFRLKGNWTNNSAFNSGESLVILAGNTQTIDGTENTTYYNLTALGNQLNIKRLVGVNAEVLNTFDLGDVEFATDENILSVLNSNLNAIVRNTGFVSSLVLGRLERTTNSTGNYLFPTGSSLGTLRYRPIEMTPSNTQNNVYGVRLANLEATDEGFNVEQFVDSLCGVNPNFYHRIYGQSAANITMFYNPAQDGDWDAMAQWNATEWDKMTGESQGALAGFSTVNVPNWSDFTTSNSFALAFKKPFLDLPNQIAIASGTSTTLEPTYIGPSPNNSFWSPSTDLSCDNCFTTVASPTSDITYTIEINVNDFCKLEKSVQIIVINKLLIPDAFTPNGDGVNDVFRLVNAEQFDEVLMRVYNRWGELIHEGTGNNHGWNGLYKSREQGIGVYVYYVEAKNPATGEKLSLNGNVSLIR